MHYEAPQVAASSSSRRPCIPASSVHWEAVVDLRRTRGCGEGRARKMRLIQRTRVRERELADLANPDG